MHVSFFVLLLLLCSLSGEFIHFLYKLLPRLINGKHNCASQQRIVPVLIRCVQRVFCQKRRDGSASRVAAFTQVRPLNSLRSLI